MIDLAALLYNWFAVHGPFYSDGFDSYLRGDYEIESGTPWYLIIWVVMLATVGVTYALQYFILDSSTRNKKQHWWMYAGLHTATCFLIASFIPYRTLLNDASAASQVAASIGDAIGFGISNAIWGLLIYAGLTSMQIVRSRSVNSRNTTFWKP